MNNDPLVSTKIGNIQWLFISCTTYRNVHNMSHTSKKLNLLTNGVFQEKEKKFFAFYLFVKD